MSTPIRLILGALGIVCIFILIPTESRTQTSGPASVAPSQLSFQITFGDRRAAEKAYDGSLRVKGGRLLQIEGWRFLDGDKLDTGGSWKLKIHRIPFENQPDQSSPFVNNANARNLVPAGVIVTVESTSSSVDVETAQGNFQVPVGLLEYGRVLHFLNDDVTVQRAPSSVRISPQNSPEYAKAEDDYPSLAVTRKGAVWYAWQAYQDRGDRVYAMPAGGKPIEVTEGKADVYRTSVAEDGAGKIHVVWSERRGEDWQLWERVLDGTSLGARRQITSGHSPNVFHKLVASKDGKLHLVWVGFEDGVSYLYSASSDGERWSAAERIGGPSVWAPDAATDSKGDLFVAWDSYQNGNYDIFFREIQAGAAPGPVEQVTTSPRFQAHPSIAVDAQQRPWLAWDESGVNWGKDWTHEVPYRGTVLYQDRTIRAVVKAGGSWKEAADFSAALPERLRRYAQLPHLAVDGAGRLWALFQIRTSTSYNRQDFWAAGGLWDLYVTTLESTGWRPASLVPHSTGRNEAPFQIVPGPDRVWMTWSNDGRTLGGLRAGYEGATMVHYDVFGASAEAGSPTGDLELSDFRDLPGGAKPVHATELQDVAKMRGYRTQVGDVNYRILRGDFHRHTEISLDGAGDGSLEDYYRYMLDAAEMDTGVVTDHNMGGDMEYSWWRTEKSEDIFHVRGRFTPLFGYERSVPYPNGHRNLVYAERGTRTLPISRDEATGKLNSGPILYPYLRQARGICMEHSLATDQGTDYRDNDPQLEPLVEIYQGYHAAYEYEGGPRAETATTAVSVHGPYRPAGFWWNALAKGFKLGVQASSDHISTHTSYAMIYTRSENRKDIVESMRARHAYAATDNILVDFQAVGKDGKRRLMGDEFRDQDGQPKFAIKVVGTQQIKQLELVRNNKFIYATAPDGANADLMFADPNPEPGESYYYLRVTQIDGNLAWSSPIWIQR